jgi:hypothetical protein
LWRLALFTDILEKYYRKQRSESKNIFMIVGSDYRADKMRKNELSSDISD